MLVKILNCLLLSTVFPILSSAQQEEQWDTYIASYDKGPGSVVLNMSLKQGAPVKQFSFVLVTGVTFKNCEADGMPSKEEFENLYAISDTIKSVIDKKVENIFTGSFTYQCQRLDYYFLKDTINIRKELEATYNKNFKKYGYYINIKPDPEWKYYLEFLYPNEETMEYMSNQKIVLKLQEGGDHLIKPRQVDHWLYFNSEIDRETFIKYAKSQNFKIESSKHIPDGKLHFQLQISRVDKVDLSSISNITLELRRQAQKMKGEYDGWETFLIKD